MLSFLHSSVVTYIISPKYANNQQAAKEEKGSNR